MDDLIRRQAAIDAIRKDVMGGLNYEGILTRLPSVTPKQRTGHWIESRCDMWVCSNCGHTYTDLSGEKYGMNFCPNCGAKMESEVPDEQSTKA